MYISRLSFATLPGHTHQVEAQLRALRDLVARTGGSRPRVLRTHYASIGAADLVFEQEVAEVGDLEKEITDVTGREAFQQLSREISQHLAGTPKRELFRIVD